MSGHYSYNLQTLAAQGSNSHHPTFTNPFATYRPQVAVMEAFDADNNSPLPAQATLAAAKNYATSIRDKKVSYPIGMEGATYTAIDYKTMPKSRDLIADAESGQVEADTFFDDFLTAEFYRGALRPNKRVEDATIPKTATAMKLHVDLLVRAFKSTNLCDDNPGMIQPFLDRRHEGKLVECLCWNLVKACIYRSKSDEPLLTAYEPYKAKNSPGLDTFEKRFDAISVAMARSKTICKHLYDAPYINTFVDDPLRSIRRVDANRDLNKQKAGIMAQGKALQQQLRVKNGGVVKKNGQKTRKRSAATTELAFEDLDRDDRSSPHTPLNTHPASLRLTASAPTNGHGRVTRRMSKMMAEADGSPFGSSSTLQSPLTSSPLTPQSEIKNETAPFRQQEYGINGHNRFQGMGMHAHVYDPALMQGISFPSTAPRYPGAMPLTYNYHNPYGQMNYMSNPVANNVMGYRSGPRQPEEVAPAISVSFVSFANIKI